MTIGLTYDLRADYLNEGFSEEETAEFDRESTIEGLAGALQSLGYAVDRIGHVRHLIRRLEAGDRWAMVFNICEGMYGIGREAQVPALLDVYQVPYTFSDPLVLAVTLHKGMTKRIVRDAGIPTPPFAVIEHLKDLDFLELNYPLFVKPNAEGTGKGISGRSKADNILALRTICAELLTTYPSGLLVEEYLPGREFTVGILGTGADAFSPGIMEIVHKTTETAGIYSYHAKSDYERTMEYSVPEDAMVRSCTDLALRVWNTLGCRDGGRIDLRVDRNGVPNFIEVNPLAGLDKVHSDLPILAYKHGYTYEQIIAAIMNSARKRLGLL